MFYTENKYIFTHTLDIKKKINYSTWNFEVHVYLSKESKIENMNLY